jgi:NitT/TauT family transport system permease protein
MSDTTAVAADARASLAEKLRAKKRKQALVSASYPALTWASVLGGILLWEIIGRAVGSSLFLATPLQTWNALVDLWRAGELQHHMWVSGQEFFYGYFLACAAGVVIGLVMASFPAASAVMGPWVSGLYATPIIAVAPLVILWFGIGIWSKIVVVISVVIFPVIINTEAGVRATDRHLIEAARAFGASRLQIFMKVSLPSALPFILAGLRLGVGRGLIGVVVGELFGARAGVGFMILQAAEAFAMPKLFAGVIVLAAAGIGLTWLCQVLERRLVPWNRQT